MGSFKAARLTNNDLLSSFDNAVGELERQICDTFGFTIDENITESPITFSNAGVVTKAQIRREVATQADFDSLGTISYVMTDSGGSLAQILYLTGAGSITSDTPELKMGLLNNSLFISMNDGALGGNTTQDTSNEPLIPATGMLSAVLEGAYYYNAQGVWAKPGIIPFAGVILAPSAMTVIPSVSPSVQTWTETVDVGGYFTSAAPTLVTVPSGGDGKYVIDINLTGESNGAGLELDLDFGVLKNGASVLCVGRIYEAAIGATTPHHNRLVTTATLAAGDTISLSILNSGDATVIFGDETQPDSNGGVYDGRMAVYRIE